MAADNLTTSEAKALAWTTAFAGDPALHSQFPVRLMNGKSVPGLHVACRKCGSPLSGDRVRGRVIQSLPHVVTVTANGYCDVCKRMTHIDCRFRTQGQQSIVEWLGSNGYWQAREMRKPRLPEKIFRDVRRLAAWFGKAM